MVKRSLREMILRLFRGLARERDSLAVYFAANHGSS